MKCNTWENGEGTGVLTRDMQRMVRRKDAGFVATVRADGTPEMAHPASVSVWDDDHLVFMEDMFSHETVANLKRNPAIEVTVFDSVTHRAYRFTGRGEVLSRGRLFDRIKAFFRDRYDHRALARVKRVCLIAVQRAEPLVWSIYDTGASEDAAISRYVEYHGHARRRVARGAAGSERRNRS